MAESHDDHHENQTQANKVWLHLCSDNKNTSYKTMRTAGFAKICRSSGIDETRSDDKEGHVTGDGQQIKCRDGTKEVRGQIPDVKIKIQTPLPWNANER